MKFRLRVPLVVVASWGMVSAASAVTIQRLADQVSVASYTNYHQSLFVHAGESRDVLYGAQHDAAREVIRQDFAAMRLNPSVAPFTWGSEGVGPGFAGANVIATRPGTDAAAYGTYIVGAHYDSLNGPGADDNASGVAGMLEAARVLSHYTFKANLVFVAFDAEEYGNCGSKDYVAQHAADDIRGMVCLDGIGHGPQPAKTATLCFATTASPIGDQVAAALATYGGLNSRVWEGFAWSDHAPFDAAGIPAVQLLEGGFAGNAANLYHAADDNVDTPGVMDYDYAAAMTRGVVGYLATEAVLVPEPAALLVWVLGAGCAAAAGLLARRRRG